MSAPGDFLSGFQSNTGWLQNIPDWISHITTGADFNSQSLFYEILRNYWNPYIEFAFIGLFFFLSYMTYFAWLKIRDEI